MLVWSVEHPGIQIRADVFFRQEWWFSISLPHYLWVSVALQRSEESLPQCLIDGYGVRPPCILFTLAI